MCVYNKKGENKGLTSHDFLPDRLIEIAIDQPLLFYVTELFEVPVVSFSLRWDHLAGVDEVDEFRLTHPLVSDRLALLESDRILVAIGYTQILIIEHFVVEHVCDRLEPTLGY